MRPDGVTSLNVKARRKVDDRIGMSPQEGKCFLDMRESRAKSLSDGKKEENRIMKREKVTGMRFLGARKTLYFRVLA